MNNLNKDNTICQESLEVLIRHLEQDDFDSNRLKILIEQYPNCKESLESTYSLWAQLNRLETPQPRAEMSSNFYKKLNEYDEQQLTSQPSQNNLLTQLKNWRITLNPVISWSMALGLFVFGFFAGQLFSPNNQQQQIEALALEVKNLKKQNSPMNPQQSVSDRMKNIQLVRQLENPNQKILLALNKALVEDPNINIRISAIQSLVHFADDPAVMEILIKAIPKQNSSLVQLELAEVMIQLEEKRSAAAWKELLNSDNVELDVKLQLQESLEVLL